MRQKNYEHILSAERLRQPIRSWKWLLLMLLAAPQVLVAQSQHKGVAQAKLAPALQVASARASQTVRVSVSNKKAFEAWARVALPAVQVSSGSCGGCDAG